MMNQVILVGRIKEIKEEKEKTIVTIVVPNSFKNVDGEYDNNYIDCILFGDISNTTKEYCKIGDVIGVKGRIKKLENDKEISIIAEKVTFLSSGKKSEDEEN